MTFYDQIKEDLIAIYEIAELKEEVQEVRLQLKNLVSLSCEGAS